MSLPVPNLDDRSFDQLVSEVRSLIPRNLPAWTDHNASDPGITFLELFAFLFEAANYQLNRIPERTLANFAALVGVTRSVSEPIEVTLRNALDAIQNEYRAITLEDFERLVRASGLYWTPLPARQDHSSGDSAVVMQLSEEEIPLASGQSGRIAGDALNIPNGNDIQQGELILVEDTAAGVSEVAKVQRVDLISGGLRLTLSSALRLSYNSSASVVRRLLQPQPGTETTLIFASQTSSVLRLTPVVEFPTSGVLRLSSATPPGDFVVIHGIRRVKAVTDVTSAPGLPNLIRIVIAVDSSPFNLDDQLRDSIIALLDPRRLITTRVSVKAPPSTLVSVGADVVRDARSLLSPNEVKSGVSDAIGRFLDPLVGGADGQGWEFGRPVFRSELFELLEQAPGVDYVRKLQLGGASLPVDGGTLDEVQLVDSTSLVGLNQLTVTVI
jgi:hypothetical protein